MPQYPACKWSSCLHFSERIEERIDVGSGVGGGNKGNFESTRWGVEAVFEHMVEIGGVRFLVAGFGVIKVMNGFLAEEGGKHAAALCAVQIKAFFFSNPIDSSASRLA